MLAVLQQMSTYVDVRAKDPNQKERLGTGWIEQPWNTLLNASRGNSDDEAMDTAQSDKVTLVTAACAVGAAWATGMGWDSGIEAP